MKAFSLVKSRETSPPRALTTPPFFHFFLDFLLWLLETPTTKSIRMCKNKRQIARIWKSTLQRHIIESYHTSVLTGWETPRFHRTRCTYSSSDFICCVLHGRSNSLHMVLSFVLIDLCSPSKSPRFNSGNQRQHLHCSSRSIVSHQTIKRGSWWSTMMIHDDPWSCTARRTCTQ